MAGKSLELSLLARHALDLAQKFHAIYHRHPILQEEDVAEREDALPAVIKDTDVLVALSKSGPDVIQKDWIKTMRDDAVVFVQTSAEANGGVGVVIGDVSGHGISSALLMASTRAFLRQRSALPGTAAEIISDVNAQFSRDVAESGSFMSMFYLMIDKSDKGLRWVRAGHDPAVLYDPELDALSELKGAGIALGVDEHFEFVENKRAELREGQIILLGTDGIWEARNSQGQMFGKESMVTVLKQNKAGDADQILEGIYQALSDFQQGAAVEDDVTLIVIKITKGF